MAARVSTPLGAHVRDAHGGTARSTTASTARRVCLVSGSVDRWRLPGRRRCGSCAVATRHVDCSCRARRIWCSLAVLCAGLSLLVAVALAAAHGSFGAWWALGFAEHVRRRRLRRSRSTCCSGRWAWPSRARCSCSSPDRSSPAATPACCPAPWWQVAPWTLHGATLRPRRLDRLVRLVGGGFARSLVLGGIILVSLAALVASAGAEAASSEPGAPDRGGALASPRGRARPPAGRRRGGGRLLAPDGARGGQRPAGAGGLDDPVRGRPRRSPPSRSSTTSPARCAAGPSFQGADVGADVACRTVAGSGSSATPCAPPTSTASGSSATRCWSSADGCARVGAARRPRRAHPGPRRRDRLLADVDRPRAAHRLRPRRRRDPAGHGRPARPTASSPSSRSARRWPSSSCQRGKTPQLLDQQDIGPDDADPPGRVGSGGGRARRLGLPLRDRATRQRGRLRLLAAGGADARSTTSSTPSAWQYWDGRTLAGIGVEGARCSSRADGGVSQTLSVFERGGRWYAVSKRDEFLGTDLVVWSAPVTDRAVRPAARRSAHLPSDPTTGALRYMPLAHPDLLPDPALGGGVLQPEQHRPAEGGGRPVPLPPAVRAGHAAPLIARLHHVAGAGGVRRRDDRVRDQGLRLHHPGELPDAGVGPSPSRRRS